jgi:hypothetical protein
MRKALSIVTSTAMTLSAVTWLAAQESKRVSPHEQTSGVIAGKKITIEYGRPYKKGRKIFGGLEPFGKVWRTGADEATKLTTETDLMIGNIHVPKGTYSLFTIPDPKQWTLILNKVADQWGAYKYDQSQDLGRTAMKTETVNQPLEQLTISIEPAGGNRGTLKIAWDTTVATVPIMVH